jgi:putative spermidine/putrescine transport system permease protein
VIHQAMRQQNLSAWLYVAPLMLVLVPFFLLPTLVVLVASFFETDGFGGLLPTFTLSNYAEILTSAQTFHLYAATLKFAVLTWLFTLIIGFSVAYFLVFHVKNQLLAISLFLICTIPFWTSNIIRMISGFHCSARKGWSIRLCSAPG